MLTLNINGENLRLEVDADTPLLWAIREEAGLTGTKFGCDIGQCGACTVLINGNAVRSCTITASAVQGMAIETIESLASDGTLNAVQQAWLEYDVPQCGYCQSGQIMAATAMLRRAKIAGKTIPEVPLAQLDNICRCGTYNRIRPALNRAFDLAYEA